MSIRRTAAVARTGLLLAGVAASLALSVAPAAAAERGVGVNCHFDEPDRILNIQITGPQDATIERTAAGSIQVNGAGCGYDFLAPTVSSVMRIAVRGDDSGQDVTIDLSNGGFAPGYGNEAGNTDEIEFSVLLGKGQDELRIDGTSGVDTLGFGWVQGTMVVVPAINLNVDGDHDVTHLSVEYVNAWGYGGKDVFSGNVTATGTTAFERLYLHGGPGDDQLTGGDHNDNLYGDAGADVLKGGKGIDELFGTDGVGGNDQLQGGSGIDECTADAGDFVGATCEGP